MRPIDEHCGRVRRDRAGCGRGGNDRGGGRRHRRLARAADREIGASGRHDGNLGRNGLDSGERQNGGGRDYRYRGAGAALPAPLRARRLQRASALGIPRERRCGHCLPRAEHVGSPKTRRQLSGLLPRFARSDGGRTRAGAGCVRRTNARKVFSAASAAVAGVHAVRRHDGRPRRHPAFPQGRAIVPVGGTRGASRCPLWLATAVRESGDLAVPRQRTGGAVAALAVAPERRARVEYGSRRPDQRQR